MTVLNVTSHTQIIEVTTPPLQEIEFPQAAPVVNVISAGPPGPAGVQGPIGPPGSGGSGGSGGITIDQPTSSTTWVLNHNFGYKPVVSVYSIGGIEMVAEIAHMSDNQVQVRFNTAVAGQARLT